MFSWIETDVQSFGNYAATGVLEADNGIGVPVITEDHEPPNAWRSAIGGGTRLFTRPVAAGTSVVNFGPFPFDAKASAHAPSGNNNSIMSFIWMEVSYAEDNRSVLIYRPGAIGEALDASTNTTYGHSTFSYYQDVGAPHLDDDGVMTQDKSPQLNPQTYEVYGHYLSGDWSNNREWSWSGGGTPTGTDSEFSATRHMPFGSFAKDTSGDWKRGTSATPGVVKMTYTVKDLADGAAATAHYSLTLHEEWENLRPDPSRQAVRVGKRHYLTLPAGAGTFAAQNPVNQTGPTTANWTFTITGTFTLGTKLTAGVKLGNLWNLGFDVLSLTGSFSAGSTLGVTSPPIQPGYKSYPYVEVSAMEKPYLVDHYIPAGLEGTHPQDIADPSTTETGVGWDGPYEIDASGPI